MLTYTYHFENISKSDFKENNKSQVSKNKREYIIQKIPERDKSIFLKQQ